MSIHTNEEAISGWTVEKGRDYVISTGREIGWWVVFARGTRAVALPEHVFIQVVRYKTTEGTRLSMTKYGLENTDDTGKWKKIEKDLDLGDLNSIYMIKQITSGGDYLVHYRIYFSYYNFLGSVEGYGLEKDVSHDFVEEMTRKILSKLETANLEQPRN